MLYRATPMRVGKWCVSFSEWIFATWLKEIEFVCVCVCVCV